MTLIFIENVSLVSRAKYHSKCHAKYSSINNLKPSNFKITYVEQNLYESKIHDAAFDKFVSQIESELMKGKAK